MADAGTGWRSFKAIISVMVVMNMLRSSLIVSYLTLLNRKVSLCVFVSGNDVWKGEGGCFRERRCEAGSEDIEAKNEVCLRLIELSSPTIQ